MQAWKQPHEILKLVIEGKTNGEIAKIFNVSITTIIDKFKQKYGTTPQKYLKL